jgi:hypothetical protein
MTSGGGSGGWWDTLRAHSETALAMVDSASVSLANTAESVQSSVAQGGSGMAGSLRSASESVSAAVSDGGRSISEVAGALAGHTAQAIGQGQAAVSSAVGHARDHMTHATPATSTSASTGAPLPGSAAAALGGVGAGAAATRATASAAPEAAPPASEGEVVRRQRQAAAAAAAIAKLQQGGGGDGDAPNDDEEDGTDDAERLSMGAVRRLAADLADAAARATDLCPMDRAMGAQLAYAQHLLAAPLPIAVRGARGAGKTALAAAILGPHSSHGSGGGGGAADAVPPPPPPPPPTVAGAAHLAIEHVCDLAAASGHGCYGEDAAAGGTATAGGSLAAALRARGGGGGGGGGPGPGMGSGFTRAEELEALLAQFALDISDRRVLAAANVELTKHTFATLFDYYRYVRLLARD